jgi:hypothetical protein
MIIKRRSIMSWPVGLLAGGVVGSRESYADRIRHRHVHTASLMTECAKRFLAALDADQRDRVAIPFDSDERLNWHFIPNNTHIAVDTLGERKGLALREMTPYQKHLAGGLLAAGLSQTGYIKAVTIMSLEDVLKIIPPHLKSEWALRDSS